MVFIDKYVSCSLPETDEELCTLVQSLQICTIIHKHAGEKEAVDCSTQSHHRFVQFYTIILHEPPG